MIAARERLHAESVSSQPWALVVAETAEAQRLIQRELEGLGYAAEIATGADRAIDALAVFTPTLIAVDESVALADRRRLVEFVKSRRDVQRVPIVWARPALS